MNKLQLLEKTPEALKGAVETSIDAYDALTGSQPYAQTMALSLIAQIIRRQKGDQTSLPNNYDFTTFTPDTLGNAYLLPRIVEGYSYDHERQPDPDRELFGIALAQLAGENVSFKGFCQEKPDAGDDNVVYVAVNWTASGQPNLFAKLETSSPDSFNWTDVGICADLYPYAFGNKTFPKVEKEFVRLTTPFMRLFAEGVFQTSQAYIGRDLAVQRGQNNDKGTHLLQVEEIGIEILQTLYAQAGLIYPEDQKAYDRLALRAHDAGRITNIALIDEKIVEKDGESICAFEEGKKAVEILFKGQDLDADEIDYLARVIATETVSGRFDASDLYKAAQKVNGKLKDVNKFFKGERQHPPFDLTQSAVFAGSSFAMVMPHHDGHGRSILDMNIMNHHSLIGAVATLADRLSASEGDQQLGLAEIKACYVLNQDVLNDEQMPAWLVRAALKKGPDGTSALDRAMKTLFEQDIIRGGLKNIDTYFDDVTPSSIVNPTGGPTDSCPTYSIQDIVKMYLGLVQAHGEGTSKEFDPSNAIDCFDQEKFNAWRKEVGSDAVNKAAESAMNDWPNKFPNGYHDAPLVQLISWSKVGVNIDSLVDVFLPDSHGNYRYPSLGAYLDTKVGAMPDLDPAQIRALARVSYAKGAGRRNYGLESRIGGALRDGFERTVKAVNQLCRRPDPNILAHT